VDIKTLLEITTVELTVTNKKELKVKLFDVLEGIISRDLYLLEKEVGKVIPNYVYIIIKSRVYRNPNRCGNDKLVGII